MADWRTVVTPTERYIICLGATMRQWMIAGLLAGGLCSPAGAEVQIFQLTMTITSEYFNGEETTGQSLSLIHAGDIVRGRFTFDDSVAGTAFGSNIFYINPITSSRLVVSRSGATLLALTQRPVFFANGNQADYSQVGLTDGDPLSRRDVAFINIGGGDADSGSVVGLSPDDPAVYASSWSLSLREDCSSGSVATGDCINSLPGLDFFDGTSRPLDLTRLFNVRGASGSNIVFQYENGDYGEAIGTLDAIGRVPEPDTWAMLVVGFSVCGLVARRRSKSLRLLA